MSPVFIQRILKIFLTFILCIILYKAVLKGGSEFLELEKLENKVQRLVLNTDEEFEKLLLKDTSEFLEEEDKLFFSHKEKQYAARRDHIRSICHSLGDRFEMSIRKNSLLFDGLDAVAYCPIAKVASSTWCDHFINLCE